MFNLNIDPFSKPKRRRKLTTADRNRVAAKQGWECAECKERLHVRFHIHHEKPFSEGGSDVESNLQALCSNCHNDKTEEDRHRKRQEKINREEREEKEGLFGPSPFNFRL